MGSILVERTLEDPPSQFGPSGGAIIILLTPTDLVIYI